MASAADMSLDDYISKNKISTRGSRGGRGRGRGSTRGQSRGSGASRAYGQGSFRGSRTNGFASARSMNGRWSHDMYTGGPRPYGITIPSVLNSVKLIISNLDFGVSDSDIKELFAEFGPVRSAGVNYDRTGRSLGTGFVIYERRADALRALQQYNGVHLDGRAMKIEVDPSSGKRFSGGGSRMRSVGSRGSSNRGFRGRGARGGGRGGAGKTQKKAPTNEELDAELDAYVAQSQK